MTSSPNQPRPQLRSIGQGLASLKNEFPDISISKIRFLEAEGLISPERAPSGYRRYDTADVERLRYVLAVQRDHYLPLKVIREHLEAMDRGQPPPPLPGALGASATGPQSTALQPGALQPGALQPGATQSGVQQPGVQQPGAEQPGVAANGSHGGPSGLPLPPRQPVRLTRAELLEASGLTEPAMVDLERQQIVVPKRGSTHYGREALTLAIAARRLAEFGVDGRHLRAFKMSADREVGLVEQAIAPYVRRAGSGRDVAGEVTQLVISFHAALVRLAMER